MTSQGVFYTFDPEWLVRFSPTAPDGKPRLYASDMALLLAVAGRVSETPYSPWVDEFVAQSIAIGDLRDGDVGQEFAVEDAADNLRRDVGVRNRADFEACVARVSAARNLGQPCFREVVVTDTVRFDVAPGKAVMGAHPGLGRERIRKLPDGETKRYQDKVTIDLAAVAQFACVHTFPVFARLRTWLGSSCRIGLAQTAHEFRKDGSFSVKLKVDRIPDVLGFNSESFSLPEFKRILPRIVEDLEWAGIGMTFGWIHSGRFPRFLTIRTKQLKQVEPARRPASAQGELPLKRPRMPPLELVNPLPDEEPVAVDKPAPEPVVEQWKLDALDLAEDFYTPPNGVRCDREFDGEYPWTVHGPMGRKVIRSDDEAMAFFPIFGTDGLGNHVRPKRLEEWQRMALEEFEFDLGGGGMRGDKERLDDFPVQFRSQFGLFRVEDMAGLRRYLRDVELGGILHEERERYLRNLEEARANTWGDYDVPDEDQWAS